VIVFDRERLGNWALERIPYAGVWESWYQAIGLERDGRIIASVVYTHFTGYDIAMHVAAERGRMWARPSFLRACFTYPFEQLQCRRVTGYVPAKSADVLAFDRKLGFVYEGRLRKALPDDDLVVLGMLREECRYIGQEITTARAA
jgi:RimJ/RimL family protein N-acetyltransferase